MKKKADPAAICYGTKGANTEVMFDCSDASQNSGRCKSCKQNYPVAALAWISGGHKNLPCAGRKSF